MRRSGNQAGRGHGARAREARHPSVTTSNHQHADGCEPFREEGCHMSSIIYLVGLVVVIGFVLKLMGIY
jgi:hypothetical protein